MVWSGEEEVAYLEKTSTLLGVTCCTYQHAATVYIVFSRRWGGNVEKSQAAKQEPEQSGNDEIVIVLAIPRCSSLVVS